MSEKKNMRFGLMTLSVLFLFNPNINIIDVLPDFIGYILLCIALTPLADMNDSFAEASTAFKKMILIDAGKVVALFWVFGISVVSERNSSLLLWSFAFGVLEMVFVIPAFIKLFKGFSELGYIYDNTSVVGRAGRGKKSYTDKTRKLTVIFIGLKALMSFLPELADLTSTEYYENYGMINLYRYIGIMRFLAFVPVLVVGAWWLVRSVRYFRRISRDSAFCDSLSTLYGERVSGKVGIFVKRNVAVSFFILVAACIFSFDFRLESVNVLPDFVAGLLLVAFFIVISKRIKIKLAFSILFSGAYVLVSTLAYVGELSFFKEFSYSAVDRNMEARNAFLGMAISNIVSTLVFAACVVLALNAISAIVENHTGALALSDTNAESQKKMTEAIKAEKRMYIKLACAALVLYSVTDICYTLLAKDYTFMFLINTVGALIFIAAVVKLYLEVSEAVNARYLLE